MYRMKLNKYTLLKRVIRNWAIYTFTYFTSIKQGSENWYRKQSQKAEIGNKLSKCCKLNVRISP